MRIPKQLRWDHDSMEVSLASVETNATAVAVAFANGSIRKSLFQMLQMVKRAAREWSLCRLGRGWRGAGGERGKGWERSEGGNMEGDGKKFTVGHARGVKSATKNLCRCLCPGTVKWTPPLFAAGDGEHEGKRAIEGSTNCARARTAVDLQYFVAVSYEALHFHLAGHVEITPDCCLHGHTR